MQVNIDQLLTNQAYHKGYFVNIIHVPINNLDTFNLCNLSLFISFTPTTTAGISLIMIEIDPLRQTPLFDNCAKPVIVVYYILL